MASRSLKFDVVPLGRYQKYQTGWRIINKTNFRASLGSTSQPISFYGRFGLNSEPVRTHPGDPDRSLSLSFEGNHRLFLTFRYILVC